MATAKKAAKAVKRGNGVAKKPLHPKVKAVHQMRKVIKASLDAPTTAHDAVKKLPTAEVGRLDFVHWSPELGEELSRLIIEGKSLKVISYIVGMPNAVTLYRWVADAKHPFHKIYKESKDVMVTLYEEDIVDIADNVMVGEIKVERQVLDKDGKLVTITEVRQQDMTAHRAMQISARQMALSWIKPKKHGRLAEAPAGDKGNTQLDALFAALQAGPVENSGE